MNTPEVDQYVAACTEHHREALCKLRELVHKVAPAVREVIEYKMPTFKIGQATLCGMSSRAAYISLYCDPEIVQKHLSGLAGLDVGKSCIRFKNLSEVDLTIVERIFRDIVQKHKNVK